MSGDRGRTLLSIALGHFELDVGTADRLLALADPSLRAEALIRLNGGDNSAVFELRASDGRSVVIKVYSDLLHWKLAKEVYVYELSRRHGVEAPVPAVLAADDSKTLLPHNVMLLTKLEGKLVFPLLDELGEPELAAVDRQIGALLRTLHEVGFDEFGYVGTDGVVDGHRTNLEYMCFQFEKKLREFGELGGDPELRRRIERHVDGREQLLAGCARPAFCHSDCHYGNVLLVPDAAGWRVSGLLDFENVLAGDPLLDLAKTYCYTERRSEATLAALAEGYGKLRPDWRAAIDLYVLYHWLELWGWFAALGRTGPLAEIAAEIRNLVRTHS